MHRLAAFCFYGDAIYEDGILVRHLDDNKINISKSNIALGTQKENMSDISEERLKIISEKKRSYALKNGIKPPRNIKIKEEQINDILNRINKGESERSIARDLGVHHSTINYIKRKRFN